MKAEDVATLLSDILISGSGIFLNLLVTSSSFRAWHKDGFQRSQDLIVFFMGLSCTVFSSLQFCVDMSSYIWKSVFQGPTLCLIGIHIIYSFVIFCSLSMTAWLCVFYCVKIVPFHHQLLIALKSKFLMMLPRLIAGTFVVSTISLILQICVVFPFVTMENVDNSTVYCSRLNSTLMDNMFFIINMFNLIMVGPFLLIVLSLGFTVSSLVHHVRRIQLSPTLNNSNVKVHINAAKIMTLLLLLNVSFYLSNVVLNWRLVISNDFLRWMFLLIYYNFWPLQALTLLYRNPKFSLVPFIFSCRCLSICRKRPS